MYSSAMHLFTNIAFKLLHYEVGAGGPGARVDVLSLPDQPRGRIAVGTVHRDCSCSGKSGVK